MRCFYPRLLLHPRLLSIDDAVMFVDFKRYITNDDIETLARKVGDKWFALGKAIGVEPGELENIRYEHNGTRDQREMTRQMLIKWKQEYGRNATMNCIIGALTDKQIGLQRVAASLPKDRPDRLSVHRP